MKHLRKVCGGFILVLALSLPAFAGEMPGAGATDGQTQTPGITGEMPTVGITGETQFPGITGDILLPGLSLILAFLF